MTDPVRAYTRHLRPTYCPAAARPWFAANGLSWRDFVRDGIPAETLEAIGNEHGIEIARRARAEAAQQQQET